MIEAPFGSAPLWSATPSPGFAFQAPLHTPLTLGSAPIGLSGQSPGLLLGTSGTLPPLGREAVSNLAFSALPFSANLLPPVVNSEPMMGVSATALLGVVAMRRGQPQGPSNDQEVEDFIYDALELLTAAADVDVRCENGRVTLTGNVHHKRIKRDAGEVAWAIQGVNDVQNNITITSRRRARAGREAEGAPTQPRK